MLVPLEHFTTLIDGLDHPEAVTYGPDGHLYAGGEAGQIYKISLVGESSELGTTGGFILGLCLDAESNIYACDQKRREILRLSQGGALETYSSGTLERPLRVPNYPVFDAQGNLYVSDSGGWRKNDGCLFCIRPGGVATVVSTALSAFPNGLALAPDGRTLFIVLSTLAAVAAVTLHPDGTVGAPKIVVELPGTVPDGLAFDEAGGLYISCYAPSCVYRFSPHGTLELVVNDPECTQVATPTNLAFAGSGLCTLVLASLSRWHLASAPAPVPGYPLNYPSLKGVH